MLSQNTSAVFSKGPPNMTNTSDDAEFQKDNYEITPLKNPL